MTIVSSNALFVDDWSTNHAITCAKLLHCFGTQALMDPLLSFSSYLYITLACTLLCFCFVSSHFTSVLVATLYFVLFS
ncbi:hypothetical protein AtNW77_Chr1g0044721 [Arabidopsis thaliana]